MVPFNYRNISQIVLDEFLEKILAGESLTLLGSRFVGKRHVMQQLRARLDKAQVGPIVQVDLLADPPITSEGQVRQSIEEAIKATVANDCLGLGLAVDEFGDALLDPLDQMITALRNDDSPFHRRPILIASNVDSLAHHLSRAFLEGVRTRIESGKLIAILSGEEDLQYLVESPKGGFNCAHQYVLKAYERDEFRNWLFKYANKMNLSFEAPEAALDELFTLTGGNTYSMRMILWGFLESRARSNRPIDSLVKLSEIPTSLSGIGIPDVYGTHVFRHGIQLIERDPECWTLLQNLVAGTALRIGIDVSSPTSLEMAGIAVREIEPTGAYLHFASPLQETFARQYYDIRRFGDLYAGVSMWDQAFAFYSQLDDENIIRPLGIDDRAEVEGTINSLSSALYSESTKHSNAGESINAIKALLSKGCRYILGFSEISFWRQDAWRTDIAWECIPPAEFFPGEAQEKLIASLLPREAVSEWQFQEPWNQYALVKILPALREDQRIAVVIGELKNNTVISRERQRLGMKLLEHFAEAYAHANAVDGLQIRLKVRDRHVKTMNSIFNALGSDVRDVEQVLQMAAKGLRKIEYKRAMFSLVDPEEQRIEGFLDASDDSEIDLSKMIDLPLRDYEADLQTLVVHNGEPFRIPNAAAEHRVNPQMVKDAKIESFAIVPISNVNGKVIGTLHVERIDRTVPSESEVTDLMFFGRQLAVAIEQSGRVNMLESSLDKIPEPIVIVDRTERRRYANRPAAELLHIPEGWQPPMSDQKRFDEEVGEITEQLHESLSSGNRLVNHFEGIGQAPTYRGAALTDVIKNWRNRTEGGLLHIQDFNYLHRVFAAARIVGEAQDTASAMMSMLEAAQQLLGPNNWGRLYLADNEDDAQFLTSKLSFGYSDPDVEKRFRDGGVVLDRSVEGSIDWKTFELRKPLVFCWKEELAPEQTFITPYGLKAINAPNPPQPPEVGKTVGEFWIDFPLMTQDKILGKLCFQCDQNLRPEDFELLTVLSETIVGLFDAFLSRAQASGAREQMVMASTAEKAIGTVAHNLATRFGGLSPLRGRYWLLEGKYPELKPINDDFLHIVTEAMTTAQRAKELLGPVSPKWKRFDLQEYLRHTLSSALPDASWTLEGCTTQLEIVADGHLLETAFLELIQNSKDAALEGQELRVSVTAESTANSEGEEWLRIIYADNGPGIPTEISERVFEEFFSYHPGSSTGTGIGLVFVRRVFAAHGGFIYNGITTQGAEFIIALPTRPAASLTKEQEYVSYSYS